MALLSSPLASIFCLLSFPAPVRLCHFTLTPPFLSVYLVPRGLVVLFFHKSSGHKAKENARQPSVYKAFCHVNKDKLFLLLTSHIQNFKITSTFSLEGQSASPFSTLRHLICAYMSLCVRAVYVCLCEQSCRKPRFLPGIIDLTNCRPCFIPTK